MSRSVREDAFHLSSRSRHGRGGVRAAHDSCGSAVLLPQDSRLSWTGRPSTGTVVFDIELLEARPSRPSRNLM